MTFVIFAQNTNLPAHHPPFFRDFINPYIEKEGQTDNAETTFTLMFPSFI